MLNGLRTRKKKRIRKMAKKTCRKCRMITEEGKCPNCGSEQFNDNFKGRIIVINPEKSIIAEKISAKTEGEYAVKSR